MEVKINREIREYTESVFFGLTLRQLLFSICACVTAVGLYFLLKPYVGTEIVSWICVIGAAPWAALAFVKYNGMTAETYFIVWFRSQFLMPERLLFRARNIYYEMIKDSQRKARRKKYGETGKSMDEEG